MLAYFDSSPGFKMSFLLPKQEPWFLNEVIIVVIFFFRIKKFLFRPPSLQTCSEEKLFDTNNIINNLLFY